MQQKSQLQRLLSAYLTYLEHEKGRGKKTAENYNRYLRRFFRYTKVQIPSEIHKTTVEDFFNALRGERNTQTGEVLSAKTMNYYRIALRSFLTYLGTQNIPCLHPKEVPLEHVDHGGTRETLSETECERLYRHNTSENIKQLRDRAIILLLLSTGIRVSELCELNNDIDVTKDTLLLQGAQGTYREMSLSHETQEALQAYLQARKDIEKPLFVNNGRRMSDHGSIRLTPRSVQRIVKQYASGAGIPRNVTPQMLRCTFARTLERDGADSSVLQNQLGLEHTSSVYLYTKEEKK